MRENDQPEFVALLNGIAAVKPVGKLTKEAIGMWWACMQHWTIEEFRAAVPHVVNSVEFMPSSYHFEQLRKASEPGPAEAWTLALSACKDWRHPEMLPNGAVAKAAAAVGGFRAIAMADTGRDLPHVQRRFLEAYAEISARDEVTEALPQLTDRSKLVPRINRGMQPAGDALATLPIARKLSP